MSVSLPSSLLDELDQMVASRGYSSRSQAISEMVSRKVVEHKRKLGKDVMVGHTTLHYDRSVPGLQRQLADLQSQHIAEVISSLHVQLWRQQVMEVILVQGKANRLRKIANEMSAKRGVISGRLQLMTAHRLKAGVDNALFTFFHLVDSGLHVVVDPASGHAPKRSKRPRMCIKEHLVALRLVGHKPERTTGAQLHVRDLHLIKQPANKQTFLTPVELEGLPVFKEKRHKSFGSLASLLTPGTNKVGNPGVTASISLCCDLHKQRSCRASPIPVP